MVESCGRSPLGSGLHGWGIPPAQGVTSVLESRLDPVGRMSARSAAVQLHDPLVVCREAAADADSRRSGLYGYARDPRP